MRTTLFRLAQCAALLFITTVAAWAQPVSLNWPLTSNQSGNSSNPTLATANAQGFTGGTAPTVAIFDYASGTAQRLNAGFTGWIAGPAQMARHLQFDALPAAGYTLNVTGVTFNYGATNVNGQIKAEVRYSTDNWSTSTVLAPALSYPASGFATFTAPISAPPIPTGGSFSLRILPYASTNSMAGAPTFAAHNQVKINGTSAPASSIPHVRLELRKSTGSNAVPGTYTFGITCTGGSGPYTGPASVNLVVPPNPSVTTLNVPQGADCTITETPPTPSSAWGPAAQFGGSSSPISVLGPWQAKIGPMPVNTGITVTNQPLAVATPQVRLELRKSTGSNPVPGTYTFGITCTGGSGPYTGPASVNLVVPPNPSATTLNVPQGSTCTITETQPTPSSAWGTSAVFGGSSSPINILGPWHAAVGPMPVNTGMTVTNQPQTQSQGCPNPTQTTMGCRATVTIRRTKGPAIYSVLVSPPATAPTPNVAPSTASSCVIAGGAMINQTTCWFNYNTNSTAVTLTATSSSGPLPSGFSWSGACSGSSPTCVLNVTPTALNVTANFP